MLPQEIKASLLELMNGLGAQLPAEQLTGMRNLVEAGEAGIAFENLCTQLHEYDIKVADKALSKLREIGHAMGINSKYCDRLDAMTS